MCGLFGFITRNGNGPALNTLKRMAAETETRGMHAFGLAWVSPDGSLHTFKRPGAATDNLADLDACRDALVVAGHCRYATSGDPRDNRNNHPHRAGSGWIVHNGVVRNHTFLVYRHRLTQETDCDSEALGLLIAKMSGPLYQRAAATATMTEGPLAMLGVWRDPARLLVVRRGNPMHFGETPGGFYFGSLPGELPGKVRPLVDDYSGVLDFHRNALHLEAQRITGDGDLLSCL